MTDQPKAPSAETPPVNKPGATPAAPPAKPAPAKEKEFGGPSGPEPTRYGDWERNGRVSDF